MNLFFKFLLPLFHFVGLAASSFSQNTPQNTLSSHHEHLIKNFHILHDTSNDITVHDVIANTETFSSHNGVPNLGVSNHPYWVSFKLINKTSSNDIILRVPYPIIDNIELFVIKGGHVIANEKYMESQDFSTRKYQHADFLFDIPLVPNDSVHIVFKLLGKEQLLFPVYVGSRDKVYDSLVDQNIILGLYLGIMFIMFVYNLFVYVSTRESTYVYYVVYIFFVALTQLILHGYGIKYFWPDNMWFKQNSVFIGGSLVGIATVFFIRSFLNTPKYVPKLDMGLNVIIAFDIIGLAFAFLGEYKIGYTLIDLNAGIGSLYSLVIAIIVYRKGYRPAGFFLLGWSIFLGSVVVFVLRNYGLFPYNNFTNYILLIGSATEASLLSFALADNINILKKEKVESQQQAINALQENERLITNQNIVLEQKVAQRTSQLEKAYKDLQETQTQLVSSEKMASLGQLTAGIAHEINNPINFVVSSITPLRRDIADMKELLDLYEEITPKSDLEPKLAEIERLRKEIDIDFVKDEIEMLLKGINDGAVRTAEIVKSLRTFSRVDESDLKKADLNEGLASTLVLLTQQWSGKIDVVKNLGNIPMIECYPGKLNQVFMNILNNAIQALQAQNPPDKNAKIEVTTFEKDANIIISIKDNGMGMPEEVRKKIFEPFFTTKDVGKGTGLGLSITYSIIEKHSGSIEVVSEVGKGAEFIIRLPIVDEFILK